MRISTQLISFLNNKKIRHLSIPVKENTLTIQVVFKNNKIFVARFSLVRYNVLQSHSNSKVPLISMHCL
jgi:hypothetical protein